MSSLIENLPIEVLHRIFSLIHNCYRVGFTDGSGNRRNLPQLLVLRSVSRIFRRVANEAAAWNRDLFLFRSLIPPPLHWKWCAPRFLEVLLEDEDTREVLARKTGWRFIEMETIKVLNVHAPSYTKNLRYLRLDFSKHGSAAQSALNILPPCPNLTTLDITVCQDETLSLTTLGLFPSLQFLYLHEVRNTSGTLDCLFLESFSLQWPFDQIATVDSAEELLPWSSVASLKTLAIRSQVFLASSNGRQFVLDPFVNLRCLDIWVTTDSMRDLLVQTNLRNLREFRVVVAEQVEKQCMYLSQVLSSPSFQQLEVLEIDHWGRYYPRDTQFWRQSHFPKVLDSLPPELGVLTLRLHYLHIDWFAYLARLTKLKKVVWDVILAVDRAGEKLVFLDIFGVEGFPWQAKVVGYKKDILSGEPLPQSTIPIRDAFFRAFPGASAPEFDISIDKWSRFREM
jgi:hypothetical protein